MILKLYDENDWDVYTMDIISDSISIIAINSYGRLSPPAQDYFCGGVDYYSTVTMFKPFVIKN